jgi:hypothetical protein
MLQIFIKKKDIYKNEELLNKEFPESMAVLRLGTNEDN